MWVREKKISEFNGIVNWLLADPYMSPGIFTAPFPNCAKQTVSGSSNSAKNC